MGPCDVCVQQSGSCKEECFDLYLAPVLKDSFLVCIVTYAIADWNCSKRVPQIGGDGSMLRKCDADFLRKLKLLQAW